MRIFNNPIEMIKEVERDLFEMGIQVSSHSVQDFHVENNPDYIMVELWGYGYTLLQYSKKDLSEMINYLNGNEIWCLAEFSDRVSFQNQNPGRSWCINEKSQKLWGKFLHNGTFSYTYNVRLLDQIPIVINELLLKPNTRQAIMTIYDKHMDLSNLGGNQRVPCSMHYQFLLRNGKLNLIYTMRSCDFLNHFVHDVYLAVRMIQYVAERIKAEPGVLIHFIGSLHAFKGDLDKKGIF